MKYLMYKKKARLAGFVFYMLFIMSTNICSAQGGHEWIRYGKGEFFAFVQNIDGEESSLDSLPVKAELKDTIIGGAGFGYNVNDHVNINSDIWFGPSDIVITFPFADLKIDVSLFGMNFNVDYNLLKKRFTPLITSGIGFIYLYEYGGGDLANFINDSETSVSYNLGAGFRWDIYHDLMIKAVYKYHWTEFDDFKDKIKLNGFYMSIAYTF
jgi:hypothetical protein